jgi:DNA-binding CsgD family transcriptional regulator
MKMQMSSSAAQSKNRYGGNNLSGVSEDLSTPEAQNLGAEWERTVGKEGRKDRSKSNGANSHCAGFLLLDTSLHPLYANQEALAALTYPENLNRKNGLNGFLEARVQSLFARPNGSRELMCRDSIPSGRRRYRLRMFSVTSPLSKGLKPAVAVLLERQQKSKIDLSYISARYRLTQREGETLDHLVQGFSTNQIADRMTISPNTVKAFLRSIMMKMGTDTRAGIIGKILQASNSITRETSP